MKIVGDKQSFNDSQLDLMDLINNFQEQYGSVYWNTLDDEIFIYRPLGRAEYKEVMLAEISDIEREDIICKTCLLYPENYDFDECLAGIPKQLNDLILKNSFLDSLVSKQSVVNYFRNEMLTFDNQITCIISEAFPNLDIEEIESWDMSKTAKYLSRAEWKLNILRQIPIDYEVSNQMMENDWNMQHYKPAKEEAIPQQEVKEQEAKEIKQGVPKKRTAAEIAEFKRRFPEIDWGSEIDPSVNIDSMKEHIDTVAPALRTGF